MPHAREDASFAPLAGDHSPEHRMVESSSLVPWSLQVSGAPSPLESLVLILPKKKKKEFSSFTVVSKKYLNSGGCRRGLKREKWENSHFPFSNYSRINFKFLK